MVGLSRFELLTPRLSSVCSNQLSYRPSLLLERHAGVPFQARPLTGIIVKEPDSADSLKTR